MKGYAIWIIVQVEAETREEARAIAAMGTFTPAPPKDLDFEIAKVEPWDNPDGPIPVDHLPQKFPKGQP